MMEWQGIDKRPEPQVPRALRNAGEEDAGRRRHAKRREMMLGNVIAMEPASIIGFRELEALLMKIREWQFVAVKMIEDAKIHYPFALRCGVALREAAIPRSIPSRRFPTPLRQPAQ
jgi:hypothetical protein